MKRNHLAWLLGAALILTACGGQESGPARSKKATQEFAKLKRADFNRRAAELYLPLFWRSDANGDNAIDPGELVTILGVAGGGRLADYVDTSAEGGRFTELFLDAYRKMSAGPSLAAMGTVARKRQQAVLDELGQGRPTLVESDFSAGSAEDKAVVEHVLAAAAIVETIYAKQMGVFAYRGQVPVEDTASRMLMYRNQGPFCQAPKTETDPNCNALVTQPKKISGLYPAIIQNGTDIRFCAALEKREDASELLSPFTVVAVKTSGRAEGDPATDDLEPLPYTAAYKAEMADVSTHLMTAAAAITDPSETPLKLYLATAAESFLSNDWQPADEAWARMNAANSKWYLRIGPDEVYDDPCSRKAMFHVTFARINPDGLEWQRKLEPRKAEMEAALAKLAGPPYEARQVTFRLPDFIDIVLNAGDSRKPSGGTVGQSLPNWGPVANEGRGRTVAMVNLYTDPDSEASWKTTASSIFCAATMDKAAFDPKADVMSSVLHEAAHNLGPSHEYAVNGLTDDAVFGGQLASMLEELKAQTSALYLADWLAARGLIDQATAERAHLRDVTWAFGHISQGMYDAEGKAKPYSQVAAIQMGTFFRAGVLNWRANEQAASRTDKGCFDVDLGKWQAETEKLESRILHIKAAGDLRDAQVLLAEFVNAKDDWATARDVIRDRYLRAPKASFVYAVER